MTTRVTFMFAVSIFVLTACTEKEQVSNDFMQSEIGRTICTKNGSFLVAIPSDGQSLKLNLFPPVGDQDITQFSKMIGVGTAQVSVVAEGTKLKIKSVEYFSRPLCCSGYVVIVEFAALDARRVLADAAAFYTDDGANYQLNLTHGEYCD